MVGTCSWRTIISRLFGPEFPENRENNREFAIFLTGFAILDIKSRINFNVLHTNSLQIKTGNVFRPGVHPCGETQKLGTGCDGSRRGLRRSGLAPEAIATYCLPLTSKLMGGAAKRVPTLIFHSCSSVVSSKAATVPSNKARNTRPPPVESVPERVG